MKIDVSGINGYASMSAEEKVKALESLDLGSKYVSKDMFDKTASELSSTKKELASKLSADEQKALAAEEEAKKILAENESLKKQLAISSNTSKLIELGYDSQLAEETATAMAEGKLDVVFANQQKFRDAVIAQTKADALKNSPTPSGGGSSNAMTKERLQQMTLAERMKFSAENPEVYKEIYK